MAEALSGIRVLEVGGGAALAYAGKLFADFGAEVLKLDAADDPLHAAWPLVEGRSALQAWLNTNKHVTGGSVTALAPGCHVLLDGRATALADEALPPHLIATRISWFGASGPYAGFAATDVTCRALAGVFACTGPVEGPPAMLGGIAGEVLGGIAAFIATAASLWGGGGRRLEASIHEANISIAEYQAAQAVTNPEVEQRLGINRFAPTCPMGVYRCREGWLGVTIVTPAQWRSYCEMVGLPELGQDPDLIVGFDRMRQADRLDAIFSAKLLERTAESWFEEALARRLPFAVVPEMATLLATPTHRARHAFQRVRLGDGSFEGPTLPQRLTRTPPRHAAAPAALPSAAPALQDGAATEALPLKGLRVVDLSMGWAGPYCTRSLGDLGAEIIKVEAIQYPDWWRGVDPRPAFFTERRYEQDVRFAFQNRNKRGITLDLSRPEGAALLQRLVAASDAVVENYAREVLPKLGLDYTVLSRSRPDLVMLSMPAFGAEGPWRDARAYGSTLEHASGLPTVAGPAHAAPMTNQLAYGDPVGGLNAAAALLTALLHRKATGEGQHIDLAQVECMFPLVAPWMIAQSALGDPGPRRGNRHPMLAPHGAFPCAAEGWLAIAVTDDAAWARLCGLMGRADLAALALDARRAREDELEAIIAGWTRGQDADAAMLALQGQGIAAGVVRWPTGLRSDPHLAARGFWQAAERPFLGRHKLPSAPFRPLGGAPLPITRAAPTLGQDNAAILGGLLRLDAARLAALEADGIIGTEAIPAAERKPRSKPAQERISA
ncbi:CoA transferase [Sediminicoccus sp. BL-A-41-H5]|uniref:CaiB/BaiF CoA-transferase family protein n=1 Tax=Sediminicoccus sp. BL-A-41-H5 TaxID=3421106 RepID=UPI003D66A5C0